MTCFLSERLFLTCPIGSLSIPASPLIRQAIHHYGFLFSVSIDEFRLTINSLAMKRKHINILRWSGLTLVLILAGLGVYIYTLSNTPYGRLDYRQAIFLKFIINAHPGPAPGRAANGTWLSLGERRKLPYTLPPASPFKNVCRLKIGADSVPVQLYIPETGSGDKLPVIIDFHGGAWVMPLNAMDEESYRMFANQTQSIVVGVDYRVAPEHPFPAAVTDCYNTFKWIAKNIGDYQGDTSRIVLVGESAGANLAAVVARKAKNDGLGHLVRHLTLFCPAVDARPGVSYPSRIHFAEGYMLPGKDLKDICKVYAPDLADLYSPDLSIIAASDLQGMPPTFVITAQFDPLRDEGRAFADKLSRSGVPVRYLCVKGFIHCMTGLWVEDDIKRMNEEISSEIKKHLQI